MGTKDIPISWHKLLRVMPRLWIIASGAGIYAVFLGLLPILAPTPWVWALVFPAGAGGAMVYALAIGYLQDLMGRRAGAGASLIALQRLSSGISDAAIADERLCPLAWLCRISSMSVRPVEQRSNSELLTGLTR